MLVIAKSPLIQTLKLAEPVRSSAGAGGMARLLCLSAGAPPGPRPKACVAGPDSRSLREGNRTGRRWGVPHAAL